MRYKLPVNAEKQTKRRPLGLLRLQHERIETWVLGKTVIAVYPKAEPGKLRVVAA